MDTAQLFKTVNAARGYYLQHVAGLAPEQLLEQPPGTNHNILWNVGHIVYTNASVCYGPSGNPLPIPETYESLFKGGTSPNDWTETPDIEEVFNHFKRQNSRMYEDYQDGKFKAYNPLELAPGYTIENLQDACVFNCFHEGIHTGMVMKLRQLLNIT